MKNIKFESNFGRFNYSITCEIGEEVNEATTELALQGLANVGFRAVASEVNKALVKAGLAEKTTARADIGYGNEAVAVITSAAQAKLDKLASDEGLPGMTFNVSGEHVFGETEVSRKRATELWNKVNAMEETKRVGMMLSLDINEDDEESVAIEKCHAFLATLNAKKS